MVSPIFALLIAVWILLPLLTTVPVVGTVGVVDVGVVDVGVVDVGVVDVGVVDVGVVDVGVVDVGLVDVGLVDVGLVDVGLDDVGLDDVGLLVSVFFLECFLLECLLVVFCGVTELTLSFFTTFVCLVAWLKLLTHADAALTQITAIINKFSIVKSLLLPKMFIPPYIFPIF